MSNGLESSPRAELVFLTRHDTWESKTVAEQVARILLNEAMGFPVRFRAAKGGGRASHAALAVELAHAEWEVWTASWAGGKALGKQSNTIAESATGYCE